jgi:cobalt/nickel transport protein
VNIIMKQACWFLVLTVLLGNAPRASAHYNMLLPQAASAKKGDAVHFVYQWGHPFEHQLFDAPAPVSVVAISPDGKKIDLTKSLEKGSETTADKKKITTYHFRFTPEARGDYTFLLQTPPIWMEEDQEFLQDTVQTVLHVQAQTNWDMERSTGFVLQPLTRPYGLEPGMVFQVQALLDGRPVPRALVEVEPYHAAPPKELPADEHMTRSVRTDPNGVATATLTGPGWWCLTAQRDGGKRDHDGKPFPVRQRTTLWVYVDEKPK